MFYPTSFFPCAAINAPDDVMASYVQLVASINGQEDTPVLLEDLERVCSLTQVISTTEGPKMGKRPFHKVLKSYVQQIILSPVLTLLDFETVWEEKTSVKDKGSHKTFPDRDFPAMIEHFESTQSSQVYWHIFTLYIKGNNIMSYMVDII